MLQDITDESLRLKAPAFVARGCFVFEIAMAAAAFAVSYYISFSSKIKVSEISFETIDGYSCKVLSPRSDSKTLSSTTSELVQFSSTRYALNPCLDALDSNGYDVCKDGNRKDYILSTTGVAATGEYCEDIALIDNYRFCFGSEKETSWMANREVETAFPRQPDAPNAQFTDIFYFMNSSGTLHEMTAEFGTYSSALSDFIASRSSVDVYVVANEENEAKVFEFSLGSASATEIFELDLRKSDLYGFTLGSSKICAAWFETNGPPDNQETNLVIRSHDTSNEVTTDYTLDCTSNSPSDNIGQFLDVFRFISMGADGYLYAMCNIEVGENEQDLFEFFRIDFDTSEATLFAADLNSILLETSLDGDESENVTATFVEQLVVSNNLAFLSTGSPYFNLIEVDLTPQPTFQPSAAPTSVPTTAAPTVSKPPPAAAGTASRAQAVLSTGLGPGPAAAAATHKEGTWITGSPPNGFSKSSGAAAAAAATSSLTSSPSSSGGIERRALKKRKGPATLLTARHVAPRPISTATIRRSTGSRSSANIEHDEWELVRPVTSATRALAELSAQDNINYVATPSGRPGRNRHHHNNQLQEQQQQNRGSMSQNRHRKRRRLQESPPPPRSKNHRRTAVSTDSSSSGSINHHPQKQSATERHGGGGSSSRAGLALSSRRRNNQHRGQRDRLLQVKQPTEVAAVYTSSNTGTYMTLVGDGEIIYFSNSKNHTYYDVMSGTLEEQSDRFVSEDFYFATNMQLAYSYGLCNGKVDNYLVDPDVESDFADICGKVNG